MIIFCVISSDGDARFLCDSFNLCEWFRFLLLAYFILFWRMTEQWKIENFSRPNRACTRNTTVKWMLYGIWVKALGWDKRHLTYSRIAYTRITCLPDLSAQTRPANDTLMNPVSRRRYSLVTACSTADASYMETVIYFCLVQYCDFKTDHEDRRKEHVGLLWGSESSLDSVMPRHGDVHVCIIELTKVWFVV